MFDAVMSLSLLPRGVGLVLCLKVQGALSILVSCDMLLFRKFGCH
jgi:hypothetical protein